MARTLLNAEQINTVSFETKVETAVTTGSSSDDLVQKTGDIMSGTLTVPTLEVDGNQIVFNSSTTGAPASDAFITAERGSSTDAFLKWDETNDQWVTNFKLAVDSDIRVTGGIQFDDSISGDSELALYKGGTGFFVMRRYAADYTILQIWAPSETWFNPYEATLSLVRGNEPNQEYVDLYNNGYPGETQYGIRMQKRGTGQYRDFVFDYYDGVGSKVEVMKLHSDQSVDFMGDVNIGGSLSALELKEISDSTGATKVIINGDGSVSVYTGSTERVAIDSAGDMTVSGDIEIYDSVSGNRRLNLGNSGLLVKDANDVIIHDLPDVASLTDTQYMGHMYQYTNIGAGYYQIYANSSVPSSTWTAVTCFSDSNSNVKAGIFKLHINGVTGAYDEDYAKSFIYLRPHGSSWIGSNDYEYQYNAPEVSFFLKLGTSNIHQIMTTYTLICPIGDNNQIDFYVQIYPSVNLKQLIITQIGVVI